MPSLWTGYWHILKLDEATLRAVKDGRDGFRFALKLFFIIGLIVGAGKLVRGTAVLQQPTLPALAHEVAAGIENAAVALPPILADPLTEVATAVTEFEATLRTFQPPLGTQPSRLIRLLGAWLTTPFNMMAVWLGFMLLIFLFAKAMHGQGSLDQHVTLLTLAAAPQVLLLFSYLSLDVGGLNTVGPLGRLLALAAWLWSLVIVIKALAVAHEFEQGQAVKVLLLFVVGLVVLALLGTAVGGYVISGFFL
jgi:hypothetical protein